ncbi:MAG: glycosyltransferase family 4 protein [Bdellovibrionales bacterium]|nr:glycosyltransferase family 4 protein [Bdellovibrionales bacterium]
MHFTFFPQSLVPFDAFTLEERPLGGTETGVIRLAAALKQLGHEVVVYTSERNPRESSPTYLPIPEAQKMRPTDVFICIREWIPLAVRIPCKLRLYWTGDAADQVHSFGVGDKRVQNLFSRLLTVSDWQTDTLCAASGLDRAKCFTLRNGVHLPLFTSHQKRDPFRLMYSSTPFRGLALLKHIFPRIRAQVPEATLHVFSGFEVYNGKAPYAPDLQEQFQKEFDTLKSIAGVVCHGNVRQDLLAQEFQKSTVLAYPSSFAETSCITALEAIAAGCIPVTSKLGALPETLGDCGIIVEGDLSSTEFIERYAAEVVELLQNSARQEEIRTRCNARRNTLGWDHIAERLVDCVREIASAG